RAMQAPQPIEPSSKFLVPGGFAHSITFTFRPRLIEAGRKPVARFPCVLANCEPIQIPAPFRKAFFRGNDRTQTKWTQPIQWQLNEFTSTSKYILRANPPSVASAETRGNDRSR